MYIAQDLRKKNIAEYLLYMWQVEDIIRAYDCSLSRLRREYISQFDYTDEQKEEMTDWMGDLVRMHARLDPPETDGDRFAITSSEALAMPASPAPALSVELMRITDTSDER